MLSLRRIKIISAVVTGVVGARCARDNQAMHQSSDPTNWDPRASRRSSGLFSVLKWLRGGETDPGSSLPPPDILNSTSSSCESVVSAVSDDTVASFAFVHPLRYRPFGDAASAETRIIPRQETQSYRRRIADRDARRDAERDLTLRTKYNLLRVVGAATDTDTDRGRSLPLMPRTDEPRAAHRRTASDASRHRRHLHVKGKRRAPQPPSKAATAGTLNRRKRIAPQPPTTPTEAPDVICNDSLKLDRGVLKPAKERADTPAAAAATTVATEATQATPRPWYKRPLAGRGPSSSGDSGNKSEKRKSSNLSYLTNISELDREAAQIVEKTRHLRESQQAPAFMRPKQPDSAASAAEVSAPASGDSWLSPRRRSARDLIARFNAIARPKEKTPPKREQIAIPLPAPQPQPAPERSLPSSPVLRSRSSAGAASRASWTCARCTLDNDYWRIICRVCSAIKPYFDDFTNDSNKENNRAAADAARIAAAEARGVFQPRHPRINLSDRHFALRQASATEEKEQARSYEVKKSASQPRVISVFDYGRAEVNKDPAPRSNILDEILNEMRRKERQNIEEEQKLQKIAFGGIGALGNPVERMILGDEIKVEKPKVAEKEKTPEMKREAIVEKMILGDELSVTAKPEVKVKSDMDAKREERDKLKRMLIEMKNSLPKRQSNKQEAARRVSVVAEEAPEPEEAAKLRPQEDSKLELIVATTETVYENIKVRRSEVPKPVKVSSSAQTSSVVRRAPTEEESGGIDAAFQLIGAGEFVGKAFDGRHTYANVGAAAATDTLEVNRLLRKLEVAIGGGELAQAAELATELAQLKVPCSVVRQRPSGAVADDGNAKKIK